MPRPTVEPITGDTLPEFAAFLHRHLGFDRSVEEWVVGLKPDWMQTPPNHGFLLRDQGKIVGGIGALYADRKVDGEAVRTCNITSWCVMDAYRQQSMRLAMAVIGQAGYHFTDLSPTKVVGDTLRFLKFKSLDERQVVSLNLPLWPMDGLRTVVRPEDIAECLKGDALRAYLDHCRYPWLRHVLVGREGSWCHVIYKRRDFKRMPASAILYASDKTLLASGWRRLARHLLAQGLITTHIDYRFLGQRPWPSAVRSGFNQKVFLSERLRDDQIDYLYSESMALDL